MSWYYHWWRILYTICNTMAICQPVVSRLTSEDGYVWELGGQVGAVSSYGTVWEACLHDKCSYVLKYMPLRNVEAETSTTHEQIRREMTITIDCAKHGLAPEVYDAWTCPSGGAMVVHKLESTLLQALSTCTSLPEFLSLIERAYALVRRLHKLGYYHGDLHLNNVMLSKSDRMYLIDFGHAGLISTGEEGVIQKLKDLGFLRAKMTELRMRISRKTGKWISSPLITAALISGTGGIRDTVIDVMSWKDIDI